MIIHYVRHIAMIYVQRTTLLFFAQLSSENNQEEWSCSPWYTIRPTGALFWYLGSSDYEATSLKARTHQPVSRIVDMSFHISAL